MLHTEIFHLNILIRVAGSYLLGFAKTEIRFQRVDFLQHTISIDFLGCWYFSGIQYKRRTKRARERHTIETKNRPPVYLCWCICAKGNQEADKYIRMCIFIFWLLPVDWERRLLTCVVSVTLFVYLCLRYDAFYP